ncbi:MAG: T9SS type A sorting domain-containing protein [Saprospiraceae bacterium]|nr:T9SS type A sorting domain-containing protein [Saprospiraceae bacterium]
MKISTPFTMVVMTLFLNGLIAQNNDFCIDDIDYSLSDGVQLDCIDINQLIEDCTPVYIRVNVTFFLDDDCRGELAMDNGQTIDASPENAFKIAEDLINSANAFYETVNDNGNTNWGNEYFLEPPEPALFQCIPIRYVLSGVSIQCDSEWQSLNSYYNEYEDYLKNETTELNLFITHLDFNPGDEDKNGPDGFAEKNASLFVIEDLSPGLFNHETGHLFSLNHPFSIGTYDCPDVWNTSFLWENCDGDNEYIPSCWDDQPGPDPSNDEISYCDPEYQDCPHPCCEWENQTNNLMAYSSWGCNPEYSALTPCQVEMMLERINSEFCDFIEESDCNAGPPRANIGLVPGDGQEGDCLYCVHMEASMNDQYHEFKITRGGLPVFQSGFVNGPAGIHCFNTSNAPLSNCTLESLSNDIQIELTVENECGEKHTQTLDFTLPDQESDCTQQTAFSIQTSPNPVNNLLNINLEIPGQGNLKIDLVNAMSMENRNLISKNIPSNGIISEIIDLQHEKQGVYYLISHFDDQTCIEQIIKQ